MDLSDYQRLLFISFFSFIVLNSANAICAPRNWTNLGYLPSSNKPSKLQPAAVSSPELELRSPPPTSNSPSVSDPLPKAVPSVSNPASTLSPINDEAIKSICHSTDYPLLCLSSIKPYVNGRNDPLSVLEMAIRASVERTKLALFTIRRLASTSRSPALPSALDDCKGSYDDALENIITALNAIPDRDIGTMNSMLSAAITDFGDCEDEYSELSSQLPVAAEKLPNMVSNCLAIVPLIK